MSFTVDATYESGVLKLHELLPLEEHETVRVIVQTDKVRAACDKVLATPSDAARNEPARVAPTGPSDFDEPTVSTDYEMVDLWLDIPPSPTAITVIARRGPLPLPDPPIIPPNDDEFE